MLHLQEEGDIKMLTFSLKMLIIKVYFFWYWNTQGRCSNNRVIEQM